VKTDQHFYIPSEAAAVGFGPTIAHLEVQALIPGTVSLSTFAFPAECEHSRYLTTVIDEPIHLPTVFRSANLQTPSPLRTAFGP
jgi:hypothetical protein